MFVEDFLKWIPVRRRIAKGIWLRNLTVEDAPRAGEAKA